MENINPSLSSGFTHLHPHSKRIKIDENDQNNIYSPTPTQQRLFDVLSEYENDNVSTYDMGDYYRIFKFPNYYNEEDPFKLDDLFL
jgi:hypothetical protein